jgi:hypothetical protein
MAPQIGIALAVYRPNPQWLYEQLKSIQDQTFTDWVCYLSWDTPIAEVREDSRFNPFFEDKRFHWSENPVRLGYLQNFEKAMGALLPFEVNYVACCDQDDIWYPKKLEVSLARLKELGGNGLVFCDMHIMNAAGEVSTRTAWEVERRGVQNTGTFDLLIRNVIPGTGMLMSVEFLRRFPRIPKDSLYHDYWYPIVVSASGQIRAIPEVLYAYRIHGENFAGLSPYTGFFSKKASDRERFSLVQKCTATWKRSQAIARAAKDEGIPLTFFQRVAFLSSLDFGICLGIFGLMRIWSDPALARASWARAAGKIFDQLRIGRVGKERASGAT